ncbi:tail protein [Ralstonia phage PQ43W]
MELKFNDLGELQAFLDFCEKFGRASQPEYAIVQAPLAGDLPPLSSPAPESASDGEKIDAAAPARRGRRGRAATAPTEPPTPPAGVGGGSWLQQAHDDAVAKQAALGTGGNPFGASPVAVPAPGGGMTIFGPGGAGGSAAAGQPATLAAAGTGVAGGGVTAFGPRLALPGGSGSGPLLSGDSGAPDPQAWLAQRVAEIQAVEPVEHLSRARGFISAHGMAAYSDTFTLAGLGPNVAAYAPEDCARHVAAMEYASQYVVKK